MPRIPRDLFERLVRAHHGAVYRSAARVAGDEATAADVAQEVFVRVLEGKEHLGAARDERATLCWLAARLAANALRSRRRRHDHEEHAMRTRPTTDDRCDPARLSADADLHRVVQELLGELPSDLRAPLLLRHQDDLTLAAIGSALRLPTSTVHERIAAALQRLRDGLSRRGHAVAPAALPALLGAGDPPVPVGLEARLLDLGRGALPAAAGLGRRIAVLATAGAAVVGLALGASALRGDGPPAESAGVIAAGDPAAVAQDPVRPPPVREPAPVVPPPADPAPTPDRRARTTLVGTVRDAEAWPVAGAIVQVVASGGYKPFDCGDPVRTGADGAFTVVVEPRIVDPRVVRLVVREHDHELLRTEDIALPRAADAPPLQLVLPASVGSATSRYECTVAVRDEAGRALAGVEVALFSPQQPAPRPGYGKVEARGHSGADGEARLAGRGLGDKWLFVDGRPLGRRSVFTPLRVPAAGQHRTTATLAPGGELLVELGTVGGEPLEWSHVWLEDQGNGLQHSATAGPDGRFRFAGLGDGPFTLHAHGGSHWSPAQRTGLRAGGEPVVLRLKRRTELQPVGDHMAELHGRLVDESTGETLAFGPFDVDVMPMFAGESSLASDCIVPPAPAQRAAEHGRWEQFHEVGLTAGRWAIVASLPGYAKAVVPFELRAGELRTDVRIAMQRPATVRGRVVDRAGQPIKGALVFAVGVGPTADQNLEAMRRHHEAAADPGSPDPMFSPYAGRSGADGSFTLGRLPPGVELRLVASGDAGFGVRALGVLRAGDAIDRHDLRLEPR